MIVKLLTLPFLGPELCSNNNFYDDTLFVCKFSFCVLVQFLFLLNVIVHFPCVCVLLVCECTFSELIKSL